MNEKSITTKNFGQPSSEPLAEIVVTLIASMRSDYGDQFKRSYPDNDSENYDDKTMNSLRMLKRRLYKLLKPFPIQCVVDGYEDCVKKHPEYMPSVPAIIASIGGEYARWKDNAKNTDERTRLEIEHKPVPVKAQPEKIVELMSRAFEIPTGDDESRKKRLSEKIKAHDSLVSADTMTGKIRKHVIEPHHKCAHSFCNKQGSLSHGTTGHGNFYCQQHFY